jgi:hypothetical protein
LSSLLLLQRYVLSPRGMAHHPLRSIVGAIAEAIRLRALSGISTILVKVRAHCGLPGNEMADHMCCVTLEGVTTSETMEAPAPHRKYGLADTTDPEHLKHINDYVTTVRRESDVSFGMGASNIHSLYFRSYRDISSSSHPTSHHFLKGSAPFAHVRQAIRYRGGCIFSQKLAYRFGMSHTPQCPLCGGQDGQSHILGGCTHPVFHSVYCKRHNQAARLIMKEVIRAPTPSRIIQQHVGWQDELARNIPTRLPGAQASEVRPDFTVQGQEGVQLVEVKYGPDTRLREKLPLISERYAPTIRRLGRHRSSLVPILLGVGGTIPGDLEAHLSAIGIPPHRATATMRRLNEQAVRWLHYLVVIRRVLEKQRRPP